MFSNEKKTSNEKKNSSWALKIIIWTAALSAIAVFAYNKIPKRNTTESHKIGQKFGINYIDKIPVASDIYIHDHAITDEWFFDNEFFGEMDDAGVVISDEWDVTYGYEYEDIISKTVEIVEDEDGRRVSFLNLDMPDTLRVVLTHNCEIRPTTNTAQNALNTLMRSFTVWEAEDKLKKAKSESVRRSGLRDTYLEYFAAHPAEVLATTTDKLYADFIRNSEAMWATKTDLFVVTYNIDWSTYIFKHDGKSGSKMVEYIQAELKN